MDRNAIKSTSSLACSRNIVSWAVIHSTSICPGVYHTLCFYEDYALEISSYIFYRPRKAKERFLEEFPTLSGEKEKIITLVNDELHFAQE